MTWTKRLFPLIVAVLMAMTASAAAPAVPADDSEPDGTAVVADPEGDARGYEGAGPRLKRAADLLRVRYGVADDRLRVTWSVVDMTRRISPMFEVEGKVEGRRFTVDVERSSGQTTVQYWIGARERGCRGADAAIDHDADLGRLSLPVRCLPKGDVAAVRSFAFVEFRKFADDRSSRTTVHVR